MDDARRALTAQPGAVAYGSGVRVLVRGTDGGLWQQDVDAAGRGYGWRPLGGRLAPGTGATAASTGTGPMSVFVQGTDGALWTRRFSPGYDSGWIGLGGRLVGAPAAVAAAAGRVDVFVRGLDNALWHGSVAASGGWSGWRSLGGQLSSAPTAAISPTGRVDVVVRGTNGALYGKSSADGWAAWQLVP